MSLVDHARTTLEAAEKSGRRPWGWVAHSSVVTRLDDATPKEFYRANNYLLGYKLFFCDVLPEDTLEVIFSDPAPA